MKKGLLLVAVVALVFPVLLFSCSVKIDKGYEGAKINTLGSGKGDIKPLGTGWHFYNSFKYDIIKNPTFVQEYVWTASEDEGSKTNESIQFQSSNSLPFIANVGISFSIKPGVTGDLYERYHKTVGQMIDSNIRNSVRDAFNRAGSQRNAEEIYGKGKNKFIEDVTRDVTDYWDEYLTISKVYLIGSLTPPKQILSAISKKIEAKQKAQQRQNEVAEAQAQAAKDVAAAQGSADSRKLAADAAAYEVLSKAKAEAEAIKLVSQQLKRNPDYIELIKAQTWNGQLPTYMGGDGPIPMMAIK